MLYFKTGNCALLNLISLKNNYLKLLIEIHKYHYMSTKIELRDKTSHRGLCYFADYVSRHNGGTYRFI